MSKSTKPERMTKAWAERKFGTLYRVAQVVNRDRSVIYRWGKYVPEIHEKVLRETEGKK